MTFEQWRDTCWKWGSSTDEVRARRAWIMARASLQGLVADLVRSRIDDRNLGPASEFLVEAGSFFEEHPELEPKLLDDFGSHRIQQFGGSHRIQNEKI